MVRWAQLACAQSIGSDMCGLDGGQFDCKIDSLITWVRRCLCNYEYINYMSQHIGYKKCQGGRIVVLEILGKNNEEREGIVDKRFAEMRCSKARVIRIYDMHDPSIEFEEAFGLYNKLFRYAVGETVEPKEPFCEDLNKVCEEGIHYFLREEPAYFWDHRPDNGMYEIWHENGQMLMRCTCRNGKGNGLYEEWHENGQIKQRCTFKNGKIDGLIELWHNNGQMCKRCTFKNGTYDGLCEEWYNNGQMRKRCTFKNGELDGLRESWHKNGQMWDRFRCVDGKSDGLYEGWHNNGQMRERCTFKNGTNDGLCELWNKNGQIHYRCTYKDGKECKN